MEGTIGERDKACQAQTKECQFVVTPTAQTTLNRFACQRLFVCGSIQTSESIDLDEKEYELWHFSVNSVKRNRPPGTM